MARKLTEKEVEILVIDLVAAGKRQTAVSARTFDRLYNRLAELCSPGQWRRVETALKENDLMEGANAERVG